MRFELVCILPIEFLVIYLRNFPVKCMQKVMILRIILNQDISCPDWNVNWIPKSTGYNCHRLNNLPQFQPKSN
jgi:hypothetical protein